MSLAHSGVHRLDNSILDDTVIDPAAARKHSAGSSGYAKAPLRRTFELAFENFDHRVLSSIGAGVDSSRRVKLLILDDWGPESPSGRSRIGDQRFHAGITSSGSSRSNR